MGGGDEDVLDGGVEALQHGEVEQAGALGVHGQVRGQLGPVRRRRRRGRRRHRSSPRADLREEEKIGRAHV